MLSIPQFLLMWAWSGDPSVLMLCETWFSSTSQSMVNLGHMMLELMKRDNIPSKEGTGSDTKAYPTSPYNVALKPLGGIKPIREINGRTDGRIDR